MTLAAACLAPESAFSESRQIRATLEVSVTVVRVCTVALEVPLTPGCEATVREHRWAGESVVAPRVSLREASVGPSGAPAPAIMVRTVEF